MATDPSTMPALAEIFADHAPYVWRSLRGLGASESDADDLCQEVFVVVHRRLGEFEGRSSLRTWLYGICIRVASDHRRRAHVRREIATDRPPDHASDAPQTDAVARGEARVMLDRALAELDDDKRDVFVLYEIEELTMAAVAKVVGCPLQTAYSRLHAARRQVEGCFLRYAGQSPSGEAS